MSHTRGPWKWRLEGGDDYRQPILRGAGEEEIIILDAIYDEYKDFELDDDLLLIQSAWDLLRVLTELVEEVQHLQRGPEGNKEISQYCWHRVDAAMHEALSVIAECSVPAKTKGEQA